MQCADDFVAFDLAEHRQVGLAVRAVALQGEVTDLDFITWGLRFAQPPSCLCLGSIDALNGEALQEVVEVLVERSLTPGGEPARQEQ